MIRRFAVHFIEMCAAMCMGGIAVNIAVFGLASTLGRPGIVADSPEIAIVLVAFDLALAMAIYMAVRGHALRHNAEMSGSTLFAAIPVVGAYWLGLVPRSALESWPALFAFMCGPLCLLMLIVMLVRFDHYGASTHGKHAGAAARAHDMPV